MNLPELLMPAGSLEKAYTAFRYGADAIFCGCPMFSLRTRENDFTEENISEIIAFAHQNHKKVYITVNAYPHQFAILAFQKHLTFLETVKPDGIIFADWGILALAKECCPSVELHLSVQTSTMNVPAIKQWQSLGVTRIITAREMAIAEVKQIHAMVPDIEIEYFVHGSVCMAYSGRCLLSNFTGGRDANRGTCNHTCRWNYRVHDEDGNDIDVSSHFQDPTESACAGGCSKSIRDFENNSLIEEEERKGQMIPVEEDFHGTHIMSSRDMCMIEYLKEIMDAGVVSLKVEGRNKTAYYVACVARAYRKALDDMAAGKPFDPILWEEVQATANRGFFPGFLHGKPLQGDIQYEANRSDSTKAYCGVVRKWENGRLEILVKNRIFEGEEIDVVMPRISDDFTFTAKDLVFGGVAVEALHGGDTNQIASLQCEKEIPVGVFLRKKQELLKIGK
jgi:putative protease